MYCNGMAVAGYVTVVKVVICSQKGAISCGVVPKRILYLGAGVPGSQLKVGFKDIIVTPLPGFRREGGWKTGVLK